MSPFDRAIRTPDQRLRVFVSSTLRELAPERRAVRAAIEQLNLAPVMFELGARPHPPQDLYRAYLEQSDIFVGLYSASYGWVAPGDEVSGLEDEYRLAAHEMPKLVYVKEGVEREPRLQELLARIKVDGISYVYFTDADQLAELVRTDLATLLAERFARGANEVASRDGLDGTVELPAALTALIGRESEVELVVGLLADDAVRLVTITGPGGIGKSRLSIDAANRVRDSFPGGIAFVDLAPVTNPDRVPAAIADALGIRDIGDGTLDEKLRMALRDRRMLLLLDNVEQVVEAAPAIRSLLTDAPGLTVLATSRILLRLTGEHGVELGPLALPDPDPDHGVSVSRALSTSSVILFVDRVRAVKPDFELTDQNVEDVERICIALDGVPLALELAAARARVLTPAELLERLDHRLLVLGGGARDLPARQRSIRSTIEWSTQLLGAPARQLLARLGLFAGGFTLDAAEWIADGIPEANTLDSLSELVDGSLVRQQDRGDRAVFSLLAAVRQYALDELEHQPDAAQLRDRHAQYFVRLGEQVEFELEGATQLEWIGRLAEEGDNLRAAVRHLLDTGQWATAAHFAWTLYVYWWVDGHLGEVREWMQEVLDSGAELDDLTRATAMYFTRAIAFWQDPDEWLVPGLGESAELFRREGERSGEALALISLALALLGARQPDTPRADEALDTSLALFRDAGDTWGEAMALVTLGRVALLTRDVRAALARFDESLAVAKRQGDDLGEAIALHHRGWAEVLLGEFAIARDCFEQSLTLSARMRHDEGVAYGLEGLTAVEAGAGEVTRAGTLLGASSMLRERTGLYNAPSFSFHEQFVDDILAGPGAEAFESALARGRQLRVDDAVAFALQRDEVRAEASVT
ncbi:ATP-binding protein [Agromyces ramosus]|uniref:ATPase n=1 Tax=Agromyces ramosus TaxID=33879 RepID=A0ABU0RDL2_9MICO|nr:DUF4062 domain-containing protein [Agromyces ramosus]MDQ0895134.1 putative ATPase [Agromyces ramosus]